MRTVSVFFQGSQMESALLDAYGIVKCVGLTAGVPFQILKRK